MNVWSLGLIRNDGIVLDELGRRNLPIRRTLFYVNVDRYRIKGENRECDVPI
jgi:hypothetical protein